MLFKLKKSQEKSIKQLRLKQTECEYKRVATIIDIENNDEIEEALYSSYDIGLYNKYRSIFD